jgi:hypothetical protein
LELNFSIEKKNKKKNKKQDNNEIESLNLDDYKFEIGAVFYIVPKLLSIHHTH